MTKRSQLPFTIRAAALCAALVLSVGSLAGQICQLSVAGLNRARRVMGPVDAECPAPLHSAPFGNWGVTSNFGPKLNGHQFDGWCHDAQICDNLGDCRSACRDGWYEWNSCTTNFLFQAPNCTLYNHNNCTEQITATGVNVLGTRTVDLPVSCPRDSDGDGVVDSGGCSDVRSYTHGVNFMSLYELDPLGTDELIQTVYFPQTVVQLHCTAAGCEPAGSEWVAPVSYDSPPFPAKVFAEMALAVNSGTFLDPEQACKAGAPVLHCVSAASYRDTALAPESIVSSFGNSLSSATEAALSRPLPLTLAGVTVEVMDSQGERQPAPLLFVSPAQINWVMPRTAAPGAATVAVKDAAGIRALGSIQIERVSPGLFTANSNGQGVPAAVGVRVAADGSQSVVPVFQCGGAPGSCLPAPLDLGPPSDQLILILFGTGIRGRASLSGVRVTIGGVPAEVLYAGIQPEFAGLDQVNVRIPRSLTGKGEVQVLLVVEGKPANPVLIHVR